MRVGGGNAGHPGDRRVGGGRALAIPTPGGARSEKLDPAAGSIVLGAHPAIEQDPRASVLVVASDEESYRLHYQAESPSLLKLSVAWYPGWEGVSSGGDLPVLRVDHALVGWWRRRGIGTWNSGFTRDFSRRERRFRLRACWEWRA